MNRQIVKVTFYNGRCYVTVVSPWRYVAYRQTYVFHQDRLAHTIRSRNHAYAALECLDTYSHRTHTKNCVCPVVCMFQDGRKHT